jgi:putative ATP-dependent endonuclease of the OLD family
MYLKEMQLRNFRNFSKERFLFQKGINVVIGENDSGKTNALHAIRLVLDRHMNWYEKEITENLFSETLTDWRGHIIVISLRFSDVDASKEDQSMLKYITGNKEDEGSLTWFCIPDSATRKRLSETKNKIELSIVLESMTIDNYVTITTCGADADYLDDVIYEKLIGNFEDGICNWKEKLDDSLYGYVGSDNFNSIDYIKNKLIDFTYIDALRDAVNDMKQKYNPLMTMLRQIEPRINEKDKNNVKTLIDGVNGTISGVDEINKLSNRINGKIIESVGNTYAPDIVLRSELSGEIKDIFRNLKLKSNHDMEFDLNSVGLGSTNIIYVALKLMEYSFIKELDDIQSKYFLLLFEEPEAHLHKHIQMALFEKTGLNANEGVQIIMTQIIFPQLQRLVP